MKRPRVNVSLDHDVYEIFKHKAKIQKKSLSYMLASMAKKEADLEEDFYDHKLIDEALKEDDGIVYTHEQAWGLNV